MGVFCLNSVGQTPEASPERYPVNKAASRPIDGAGFPRIVSGGILNDRALYLPKPIYPEAAKASGADGNVDVKIRLDEGGGVISAEAVSGDQLLRQAAVDAALGSKFSPTLLSGQAVKVVGLLRYNFVGYRVNWHGIGKAISATRLYDNLKLDRVAEFLTEDYTKEKSQLLALDQNPKLDRRQTIDQVISDLRSRMNETELWYFDVGFGLTDISARLRSREIDHDEVKTALSKLNGLYRKRPETIKPDFAEAVREMSEYDLNPGASADEVRQGVFRQLAGIVHDPK